MYVHTYAHMYTICIRKVNQSINFALTSGLFTAVIVCHEQTDHCATNHFLFSTHKLNKSSKQNQKNKDKNEKKKKKNKKEEINTI